MVSSGTPAKGCLLGQRLFGPTPMTTKCHTSEYVGHRKHEKIPHARKNTLGWLVLSSFAFRKSWYESGFQFDQRSEFRCRTESCPTRQFPGVWELPLNSHYIGITDFQPFQINFPFYRAIYTSFLLFLHLFLKSYFSQRAMLPGTVPTLTSVFSLTWTLKMFSPGWRSTLNFYVCKLTLS